MVPKVAQNNKGAMGEIEVDTTYAWGDVMDILSKTLKVDFDGKRWSVILDDDGEAFIGRTSSPIFMGEL